MSKFNKQEEQTSRTVYTKDDYDALRAGMTKYKDEYRGIHMMTAFNQFMEELGVISFSDNYGISVRGPVDYSKWNDIRAKIAAYDDAKLKEVIDEMPEEKEAWRAKVRLFTTSVRELLSGVKISS